MPTVYFMYKVERLCLVYEKPILVRDWDGSRQDHGRYGLRNTIPTQLPCERRSSNPNPATRTASAAPSARATTEPLVTSTPPRRTAAARFGASPISTLGKMFATTTS